METPKELIYRAARGIPEVPAPAPMKAQTPVQQVQPERTVLYQPVRQNSVYRRLMQRHDRMNTRHLQG